MTLIYYILGSCLFLTKELMIEPMKIKSYSVVITTLITSILLVSQKLYTTLTISSECIRDKPIALSLTRLEPISFNDVDPDYRCQAQDYRSEREILSLGPRIQDLSIPDNLKSEQQSQKSEIEITSTA